MSKVNFIIHFIDKEPMKVTTENSVDEREAEELPQESEDPSTSESVEDTNVSCPGTCIVSMILDC